MPGSRGSGVDPRAPVDGSTDVRETKAVSSEGKMSGFVDVEKLFDKNPALDDLNQQFRLQVFDCFRGRPASGPQGRRPDPDRRPGAPSRSGLHLLGAWGQAPGAEDEEPAQCQGREEARDLMLDVHHLDLGRGLPRRVVALCGAEPDSRFGARPPINVELVKAVEGNWSRILRAQQLKEQGRLVGPG